jgi:hypothetical protein
MVKVFLSTGASSLLRTSLPDSECSGLGCALESDLTNEPLILQMMEIKNEVA